MCITNIFQSIIKLNSMKNIKDFINNLSKFISKKIKYNPRKTTALFAICLLIIIILVQLLFKHKQETNRETFVIGTANKDYDPNKPLDITDKRPLTFNQNYSKIWMQPAVGWNDNQRVQSISKSAVNYNPKQSEAINAVPAKKVTHILTPTQISDTLKRIVTNHGLSKQQIKERYGTFNNTPYLTYGIGSANSKNQNFTTMNRQTWKSRWRDYDAYRTKFKDFPIPVSPLEDMENMMNYFINVYNNTIHKMEFSKEMATKYGFDSYYISKYQLNDIHQNTETNALIYGITLIITQDISSPISYTIYVQILRILPPHEEITDKSTTESRYYIVDAETVGNTTSDYLLIPPNIPSTEKKSYYSLHNDYNDSANKSPLTPKEVDKYLQDSIKRIKGRNLDDQYACFNTNVTDKKLRGGDMILYSSNKEDCTSSYDMFGRPKETGVWDKPCKSDDECPFYDANKNYGTKNELGKCMPNGYCQMPVNVKPIGYHYYSKEDGNEPLCYNCDATKWNTVTSLGKCCEEQKDRNKYPYLKSPDYAFQNDIEYRVNENRKRNCYNKVDLNTGETTLVCNKESY